VSGSASVALWIGVAALGLSLALFASHRAVGRIAALCEAARLPPFVVGLTLVALGTDMPEIANSIVSSAAGQGDLNVGDSVGSAATQSTLVLGLLPFLAGSLVVRRAEVAAIGLATCLCLLLGAFFVRDGHLTRLEAALLLIAWLASFAQSWRRSQHQAQPASARAGSRQSRWPDALAALGFLALVAAGSALTVLGVVESARLLAAPAYLLSFFGLALGTSFPELVVNATALGRGHAELAVGSLLGASLMDASLSIGIGPLLFPNVVDAELAVRGALATTAAIGFTSVFLLHAGRLDRPRGAVLLLAYAAIYPVLLAR
jgi:cation:H+ antiporter